MAAGGEILVSRTVKDLVAGSGIEFEDFGTHALKGIADVRQIFRVTSA
jgi:class 3 adenylate cyclase